ncbi:MAG: protein kinase [Sumerlaeia bacterium]
MDTERRETEDTPPPINRLPATDTYIGDSQTGSLIPKADISETFLLDDEDDLLPILEDSTDLKIAHPDTEFPDEDDEDEIAVLAEPALPTPPRKPASETRPSSKSYPPPSPVSGALAPFAPSYRLEKLLGRGGYGEVWETVQVSLGRVIAVKRPRKFDSSTPTSTCPDPSNVEFNFRHEALITAALEHPNIVPVHELSYSPDGQPQLAMKLVRGQSWQQYLWQDEDLPIEDYLAKHLPILISMAQAVAFAHSKGIVHRDLKPQQVMVGSYGEALLMDWGLALVFDRERASVSSPHLLEEGFVLTPESAPNPAGTPAYMAPEQTERSAQNIGPWTDIYLLGGTLYYMLSGRTPHGSKDVEDAFSKAQKGEVRPFRPRKKESPPPDELIELCMRSMDGDFASRPKSVEEFIQPLQDYLSGAGRRRESRAIGRRVSRRLQETRGGEDMEYQELNELRSEVETALQLWPSSGQAKALRSAILTVHARQAVQSGDLRLAESLAGIMRQGEERNQILNQIQAARSQRRRLRDQRRFLIGAITTLAFLLLAALATFFGYRSRQAQLAATAAAERLQEARRTQYAASMKFAQSRIDDGDMREAETILISSPTEERGAEWGFLMRQVHPELLELKGPAGTLTSISFSANGSHLILTSEDSNAFVYDLTSGTLQRKLTGRGKRLIAGAISPNGHFAATLEDAGKLRVFSNATGSLLGDWDINGTLVEFSPTEPKLVVGGRSGAAYLVEKINADGSDLIQVHTLQAHSRELRAARFDPRGRFLVTASYDNTAKVWDLSTKRVIYSLFGHNSGLTDARFSQDGSRIATFSYDGTARLWDSVQGSLLLVLRSVHSQGMTSGDFSPDGRHLVSAGRNGDLYLWEVATGSQLYQISAHDSEVFSAQFSPDGTQILTQDVNGVIRVWDAPSGQLVRELTGDASPFAAPRYSPEGRLLAYSSGIGIAHISTARPGLYSLRFGTGLHEGRPFSTAVSPDGKTVALAYSNGTVGLFDRESGTLLRSFKAHPREVSGVAFTPSGEQLVSGSYDGTAKIWQIDTGDLLHTLQGHDKEVTSVAVSSLGTVATSSFDGTVRLWSGRDGKPVAVLRGHEGPVLSIAFSRNGRALASGSSDLTARLWTLPRGENALVFAGHGDAVSAVEFNPSGSRIITGSRDRRLRLWDTETGSGLMWFVGHEDSVTDIVYPPDERTFISTSTDGTFRVWDRVTGVELSHLDTGVPLISAVWLADTSSLLTASPRHGAQIWQPTPWLWPGGEADFESQFAQWQRETYRKRLRQMPPARSLQIPDNADEERDLSPFAWYIREAKGPLRVDDQGRLERGTPLRVLVFTRRNEPGARMYIAGNTPQIGDWEPGAVAFDYLEETPYGHIWELNLKYEPMSFKFTYGQPGEGWAAGEWWGDDNRSLPSQAARLYSLPDGSLLLLAEFGKRPSQ